MISQKHYFLTKYFLNVHFSVAIAYKVVTFRLLRRHIHSEEPASEIFYLGLSSNIM